MGASEDALTYFSGLGHPCPAHYNPAEFLLDLISVDTTNAEDRKSEEQRVLGLELSWEQISFQRRLEATTARRSAEMPPATALEVRHPRPGHEPELSWAIKVGRYFSIYHVCVKCR
jgi:hypothetical protein